MHQIQKVSLCLRTFEDNIFNYFTKMDIFEKLFYLTFQSLLGKTQNLKRDNHFHKMKYILGMFLLLIILPLGTFVFWRYWKTLQESKNRAINSILKVQYFYTYIFGFLSVTTTGIKYAFNNPYHKWITNETILNWFCNLNHW